MSPSQSPASPVPASRRAFVLTAVSASRVLGANDRVRLGVIGTGGRGSHLIRMTQQAGGAEIAAVSDAWATRMDRSEKLIGNPVAKHSDYRRLLETKDIDAVIVATLDHWHSRMSIDACKAGKDVFVEKPMTSLPEQGPPLARAVKETGRILQVGVQQRSLKHFIEAKQRFFDSGMIGDVHMVRTWWNANSGYLTPVPPEHQTKPADLDWDACLGWLPKIPWDPKRYFNRFAYWDFATGGQTGGLFVHLVDVVHWYLGLTKPVSAVAQGGIYQHNDGRDTPDNVNFLLDYPQKVNVSFEATISDMNTKESVDIVFLGTKGRLHIFRHGYRFLPSEKGAAEITAGPSPESDHMKNWLECVRSRKQPNANVVDGHYGAMACHIGNLAYKRKARVEWRKEWDV